MLAIVVAMALNVNFSAKHDNLSNISLVNVEALAEGESKYCDYIWYVVPRDTGCNCAENCGSERCCNC